MNGITGGMLETWFSETITNRPATSVEFGDYRIYLDEGIILMKNLAKGQIDIINNLKVGLKDALSEKGRLLLSEVKPAGKSTGNAGFFIIDEGYEKAIYVSITYAANEVLLRSRDYGLGFSLSGDFDASASDGTVIVIDRKKQRYRITRADGSTLSAGVALKPGSACFMASRELAVITDVDKVHVIHGDTRDLIEIRKLNEMNNSKLTEPVIGVGFSKDEQWLAIKDKSWKKYCLIVALSGKEKFGYEFCSLKHPFENDAGFEGLRK